MNFFLTLVNKIPIIILLLISACFVAFGDFFGKTWSLNQKNIFYFLSFLSYGAVAIFYLPTLLRESLVVTTVIYSIFIIFVSMFIGMVIFGETLSLVRWVGVILGIVSLVILTSAK
ncbi:MAG: hypothetical protein UY32_C0009G0007 [Candidatus Jorgensenbacteria bacterium GW2011_GWC1_48_8]|uniref:EamA domain-containing protein n=2 Tax=Candidatus Joergenseniibacteriota TaxID=1752739 RepID=A0A0G1W7E3_9BACT|nr:MAG: hypothetical protein UY32_C0009G0007 [Candidatus Jorgensenbacteria bacterium GW2011_GWC1_48_8]KKW14603.1 MAG: hypothetical protein UY55_C0006G0012 [Candidatus Jorgensenbacteria bacterium GW2011_GWB1_50_10]